MSGVLVTGGAGAIGSNLARTLLDAGHTVTILDDLSSGHRELVPEGARLIEGSIVDATALAAAFSSSPEYVFHLAALFANQNSVEHPSLDLEANALGTIRVLEQAKEHGVCKLLYTSSSCVYGAMSEMAEESAPGHLDTPYAITKYASEHYVRFWSDFHGLDTVIVRLFNTYGPGEFPGQYRNVIPNFILKALRKEPLPITGDGTETRDFTFVEDTVQGLLKAQFVATRVAEVYNIASGRPTTISTLATEINRLTGNPSGIEWRPRRGWDQVPHRRGITEKAVRDLGFSPQVELTEGLRRTVDWIRSHAQP